ncbi:helix-turn-helix domain-containing protein [Thalassotalea hakodatensis]|uniref:helix-turn-helix domain-containing protein n=1 Tax=Thalassotalea hakodatensis TaxID=3030492 RepID=UPI00257259C5|nr:helix-turn-helix transcriptional regulator [Thalassotalea hakodatensis]
MKKFRQSIYDQEHVFLRDWLIQKRKTAKLTQRQLADKLDTVHSLVGKVEKGERRLDVIEFISYCEAMEVNSDEIISLILKLKGDNQPLLE